MSLRQICGCFGIDHTMDAIPGVMWYTRFQTVVVTLFLLFVFLWMLGFTTEDFHFAGGQDGSKKESVEHVSGPKKEVNHKLLDTPPKRHNDHHDE